MKSYCIKVNDKKILENILFKIEKISFNNIIYTKKEFEKYSNLILHYKEEKIEQFTNIITDILVEIVLEHYEMNLVERIFNKNYFYFEEYDKITILKNYKENKALNYDLRKEKLYKDINSYLKENKNINMEGLANFRLIEFSEELDQNIDFTVNQFIIEKEYIEFIQLLKIYIKTTKESNEVVHLIYKKGESILLNEKNELINITDNIFNAKYLSDISFSSNDYALNTILTILPKSIQVHIIDNEDEFINTIKMIFEEKVNICRDCVICKTYGMIKEAQIDKKIQKK